MALTKVDMPLSKEMEIKIKWATKRVYKDDDEEMSLVDACVRNFMRNESFGEKPTYLRRALFYGAMFNMTWDLQGTKITQRIK